MHGKYSVTLSDGKRFEVTSGETILEAAIKSGIHLEYSCKDGRCGVCMTKVKSGKTYEILKNNFLSEKDKHENKILTCCSGLKSDIQIDAEDLFYLSDIVTKVLPCKIDSINRLSKDVISVVLRLPPGSDFDYLAGQYISLFGPLGERRSYSIASYSLKNKGKIELFIRLYEKGLFSEFFANVAKVNDLMRLEGPLGTFFLRDHDVDNLIFLATGTGIAPIKAIMESIKENNLSGEFKQISVYYGTRYEEDIFFNYKDFVPSGVEFKLILSKLGKDIKYVQDAVLADFESLEKTSIYACGSNNMINSAYDKFLKYKLDPKLFFSDSFLES